MQTAEQRSKNGRKSRNKGKTGEREVIAMLQPVVNQIYALFDHLPDEIPRLQRNSLQSDGGGSDIHGLEWMALEVKYHKDEAVNSWWAQTVRQAGRRKVPILFYRTNGRRWKVVMFGLLGTPSAGRTCPVTVSVEDFLVWFRIKLVEELS